MDEVEARDQIRILVSASSDPVLEEVELDMLVETAKRADADGLPPDDDNWDPTWDLNSAAWQGWTLKAGKAAGRFTFSTDQQRFERGAVISHCRQMAMEYRRRLIAGVPW